MGGQQSKSPRSQDLRRHSGQAQASASTSGMPPSYDPFHASLGQWCLSAHGTTDFETLQVVDIGTEREDEEAALRLGQSESFGSRSMRALAKGVETLGRSFSEQSDDHGELRHRPFKYEQV